jgi:hypothetical protein
MDLTTRFRRTIDEWEIRGSLTAILLVGVGTGIAVSIGMAAMSGTQLLGSGRVSPAAAVSPSPSGAVAGAVSSAARLQGGSAQPSTPKPKPKPTPTPSPTRDTRRPTIATRAPGASAVNVSAGGTIRIVFSEPVRNVSGSTIQLTNVQGGWVVHSTVRYDAVTRTATLDPDLRMYPNTEYRLSILAGITDRAGNRLTPKSWTFRVGSR